MRATVKNNIEETKQVNKNKRIIIDRLFRDRVNPEQNLNLQRGTTYPNNPVHQHHNTSLTNINDNNINNNTNNQAQQPSLGSTNKIHQQQPMTLTKNNPGKQLPQQEVDSPYKKLLQFDQCYLVKYTKTERPATINKIERNLIGELYQIVQSTNKHTGNGQSKRDKGQLMQTGFFCSGPSTQATTPSQQRKQPSLPKLQPSNTRNGTQQPGSNYKYAKAELNLRLPNGFPMPLEQITRRVRTETDVPIHHTRAYSHSYRYLKPALHTHTHSHTHMHSHTQDINKQHHRYAGHIRRQNSYRQLSVNVVESEQKLKLIRRQLHEIYSSRNKREQGVMAGGCRRIQGQGNAQMHRSRDENACGNADGNGNMVIMGQKQQPYLGYYKTTGNHMMQQGAGYYNCRSHRLLLQRNY